MKDSVGPVTSSPMRPLNHPHSNTAVSAPNAANADSIVVAAAFVATTTERNAIVRMRNVIPTT